MYELVGSLTRVYKFRKSLDFVIKILIASIVAKLDSSPIFINLKFKVKTLNYK